MLWSRNEGNSFGFVLRGFFHGLEGAYAHTRLHRAWKNHPKETENVNFILLHPSDSVFPPNHAQRTGQSWRTAPKSTRQKSMVSSWWLPPLESCAVPELSIRGHASSMDTAVVSRPVRLVGMAIEDAVGRCSVEIREHTLIALRSHDRRGRSLHQVHDMHCAPAIVCAIAVIVVQTEVSAGCETSLRPAAIPVAGGVPRLERVCVGTAQTC